MNLKIGDKVRVVKSSDFPDMVGNVYKVTVVQPYNSTFSCRVQQPPNPWNPLMFDWEIEYVARAGEQLLFPFMK